MSNPSSPGLRENPPGAKAALILGIVGLVITPMTCGYGGIIGLILGLIGLRFASKAKAAAAANPALEQGGIRTGGYICSLIAAILGGIVFLIYAALLAIALIFVNETSRMLKSEFDKGEQIQRIMKEAAASSTSSSSAP